MKWLPVLLSVSLFSPFSLLAQQTIYPSSPAPANAPLPATRNVTIDVAVTDKAGKPVIGLQAQDFTLLDDHQAISPTSFRAVDLAARTAAPPLEAVVVIDEINADIANRGRQQEAVTSFLNADGGHLPLPVSLIFLTDHGIGHPVAATQDGHALAALVSQNPPELRLVNRSTAFGPFERYQLSLKALNALIGYESTKPGRKLVVWVSPGWPLLSRTSTDITNRDQQQIFQAIVHISTELRVNHITLYNVDSRGLAGADVAQFSFYNQFVPGVKSGGQAYPANLALDVLAVQSGGLVLNGSNDLPSAMAAEIHRSATDAQSFYVLTFKAPQAEHANEYHALQVKVDRPGVTARTSTGYYAQP
jgi:VWFA-related protein